MNRDRAQPRAPRAAWLGMLTGPGAWAINTQLGYALVPWGCAHGDPTGAIALGMALLALLGALHSGRALRHVPADGSTALLAALGLALGLLFAFIILMQGSASLFFTGCET